LAAALKLAAERRDRSSVQRLLEAGAIPGDVAVLRKVREVAEGKHEEGDRKKKKKRVEVAVAGPEKKHRKFAD
jgi:hypothetical protein